MPLFDIGSYVDIGAIYIDHILGSVKWSDLRLTLCTWSYSFLYRGQILRTSSLAAVHRYLPARSLLQMAPSGLHTESN